MATSLTRSVLLLISAGNSFVALSQAVKGGSPLVVTPLSIPSSATHGLDANLSFKEGSEEVLEDFEDEPTMKKRVSNSDEEDGGEHETEAIGMCLLPLLGLLFSPIIYFYIFLYITS